MGLEFFVTSALQRSNSVVDSSFVLSIFVDRRSNLFAYAALGFATARRADPGWRGPIFDWLMQGGLERVVDGFHETGLQRGRGGTAAARYVWVLNLRASAEELAERDAAGGVDDFDHSRDHEYLAADHGRWLPLRSTPGVIRNPELLPVL